MATGTIKSNTLKYVGSGTTVNISNIKASEFVVIANYNDTFVYSITIPSAELASGSRRFLMVMGINPTLTWFQFPQRQQQ